MQITITISTENDAFQPDPSREVARILDTFAQNLHDALDAGRPLRPGQGFVLKDGNGNTCGQVMIRGAR